MALTKCLECGHEVSTSATVCPNCGAPTKTPSLPVNPPPIPNIPPPPVAPAGPQPIPISGSDQSSPAIVPMRSDKKILRLFVVPGLGLLGAYFDIYTGWTVLTAIGKTHSDYNEFASENPLAAWFLGLLF